MWVAILICLFHRQSPGNIGGDNRTAQYRQEGLRRLETRKQQSQGGMRNDRKDDARRLQKAYHDIQLC